MPGIYIHIPFCRSRCIYCDFYSTTLPQAWHESYIAALAHELELRTSSPSHLLTSTTLYLGGGTPSLLSPEALHHLFHLIGQHTTLASGAEVTIEANPDDITHQWVASLKDTPVNRISMGAQSFNDDILHFIRRRHTAEQAIRAVHMLQDAGYTNLSLDLIYGLPGQTLAQFTDDVRTALALGIPHLSAYALQFEAGTPLYAMKQQGQVTEADEEMSLECYNSLIDLTAEAGLEHYEISNFARPGFRSRHNSSYWTGDAYLGLGAGAHSYSPSSRTRSYNCDNIREYINAIREDRLPLTAEQLTDDDLYNERIMLRLRTCEGLSLSTLQRDFGTERLDYCLRMATPHLNRGMLQKKADETLCLTRRGLFVSDDIISDLML